jgi:choline kinase
MLCNHKIEEIVMIIGPNKEKFKFDNVKFIVDTEYEKHDVFLSLMAAKEEMKGGIITTYSDILFDDEILEQVIDSNADIGVVTDLDWEKNYKKRTEHPKSQVDNVIIEKNKIVKIRKNISKISDEQQNGEFIGIMRFSEKGSRTFINQFDRVEKENSSPFHDSKTFQKSYLTDMIQEIIDQNILVEPILINGKWCEIDTPQDLENAKKNFK